ncbi:MAG: periplasmic heavy metal sensor [bacterium]
MKLKVFGRGVVLALAALFLASPAVAGPGGPPPGRLPSAKQLERLADDLGLDDATRERLKGQVKATREALKEKNKAVRAGREELKGLMQADTPNRAAVMAKIEDLGRLQTEIKKVQMGALLDLQASLTPEQRAKLRERMGEMRKGRGKGMRGGRGDDDHPRGRRGRRGGRGDGPDDDGPDDDGPDHDDDN